MFTSDMYIVYIYCDTKIIKTVPIKWISYIVLLHYTSNINWILKIVADG